MKNEDNQRFRVLCSDEADDTHLVSLFNTDLFVTCLESYRELSIKLAPMKNKRYLTGETDVLLVKQESKILMFQSMSRSLILRCGQTRW